MSNNNWQPLIIAIIFIHLSPSLSSIYHHHHLPYIAIVVIHLSPSSSSIHHHHLSPSSASIYHHHVLNLLPSSSSTYSHHRHPSITILHHLSPSSSSIYSHHRPPSIAIIVHHPSPPSSSIYHSNICTTSSYKFSCSSHRFIDRPIQNSKTGTPANTYTNVNDIGPCTETSLCRDHSMVQWVCRYFMTTLDFWRRSNIAWWRCDELDTVFVL